MPDNGSKNKVFQFFGRILELFMMIAFEEYKQISQKSELIDLILYLKVEEFHGFGHCDRLAGLVNFEVQHELLDVNILFIHIVN